jgi:hypothetical protein
MDGSPACDSSPPFPSGNLFPIGLPREKLAAAKYMTHNAGRQDFKRGMGMKNLGKILHPPLPGKLSLNNDF